MKTYRGKIENGKKVISVSEGKKEYSLEYSALFLLRDAILKVLIGDVEVQRRQILHWQS